MSIFTITTVIDPASRKSTSNLNSRCFGWYSTEDAALDRVLNGGDLEECLYTHLIVEEVPEGIYSTAKLIQWYTWNSNGSCWVKCDAPEWALHTVNWGIG